MPSSDSREEPLRNATAQQPNLQESSLSSDTIVEDEILHKTSSCFVPPTISLPILVFFDNVAVSLVVPLLYQYFLMAGITSASLRELMASVFSASQIIGGILIGALADGGFVTRRTILLVSFLGSALSYAMIAHGDLWSLVFSRILVGLIKQTMTVTTTILAKHTTQEDRAIHMGRLTASATVAWIIGPSMGALLYKHIDVRAPILLACGLFLLNSMIAILLLPANEPTPERKTVQETDSTAKQNEFSLFASNLQSILQSKPLACVIASVLIATWFTQATSYNSMASYYEEMYGIEPHQRGFLSSYEKSLGFVVQSALVGPLLSLLGGERRAACLAAAMCAMASFVELRQSLPLFLFLVTPTMAVSGSLLNLALQSLVTTTSPRESLGSVLAALDVLQNAVSVTAPFYRTTLFSLLNDCFGEDEECAMSGDPEPKEWLWVSGLHWLVATLALCYFLQERKKKID